jgi:hypothetical protein
VLLFATLPVLLLLLVGLGGDDVFRPDTNLKSQESNRIIIGMNAKVVNIRTPFVGSARTSSSSVSASAASCEQWCDRVTSSMRPTMSVVEIPSVRGIVRYFPVSISFVRINSKSHVYITMSCYLI